MKLEGHALHGWAMERDGRRDDPAAWSARSSGGIVVATAHYLATAAGAEILARGGNAIDAAVAAAAALGVCEPAGSGLGGMGFAMVHLARERRTFALQSPSRAPATATPELVQAGSRYRGFGAAAVHGEPKLLGALMTHHGRLSPAEVLAPAIELAERGVPVTPTLHRLIATYRSALAGGNAGAVFLDGEGRPLAIGTTLHQPALAGTLRRLGEAGFDDFYRGDIAAAIDRSMRRDGGFVRLSDLEAFPEPRVREPLCATFRGLTACTTGPPAGGLALVEMLRLLELAADEGFDPGSPHGVLLLAGIIRRARKDRTRTRLKVGAEDLEAAAALLEPERIGRIARRLRRAAQRAARETDGAGETSHLCTADEDGNVVSLTQSIERSFGSATITPELGFLHDGFLRGFKVVNTRHPHYLRPGAPARLNAAPTILLEGESAVGALGSTGSERSSSGSLQVVARLKRGELFDAVAAPRLHATPESVVMLESRFDESCLSALRRAGWSVEVLEERAFKMGGLNAILRSGDAWCGVGEPRRDGAAAGPEGFLG